MPELATRTTKPETRKQAIPREKALAIAIELQEALKECCFTEIIKIAGSLRRKKSVVGDIELVCVPRKKLLKKAGDLFPRSVNLVIDWIADNPKAEKIKGGARYQQFMYHGIQVDLFMTELQEFGRMLALRTGPESFSKKMAARWVELGYHGIEGELFEKATGKHAPPFYTEKSFFDFLGWEYLNPELR